MKAKTPEDAIPKRLWMVVWWCGDGWLAGAQGAYNVYNTRKRAVESAEFGSRFVSEYCKYKIIRVK